MLPDGSRPDPRALAIGTFALDREGKVLDVILNGRSDGTNEGILTFLRTHPPKDYRGKIREPTVRCFTKSAVEAGIIEAREVAGRTIYIPLADGPDFARATPAGLAFRTKVLEVAGATPGALPATPLSARVRRPQEVLQGARTPRTGSIASPLPVVREASQRSDALSPLVLVENERTAGGLYDDWKDVTGERYHFPNQYRNRFVEGRHFVYYRGVRRKGGGRGQAEYFGTGRIGAVYPDTTVAAGEPRRKWKWFCDIEDYARFPNAVAAQIDGEFLERIPRNFWGVAVRELPALVFAKILQLGGSAGYLPSPLPAPPVGDVKPKVIRDAASLLITKLPGASRRTGDWGQRRSPYAKSLGDRAEEIVFDHLARTLPPDQAQTLRWLARAGATPGWDIEYRDEGGESIAVEVKGTSGPRFPSLEVTANEWAAARELRGRFHLYLVTQVLSERPILAVIRDPSTEAEVGSLCVEPLLWRLERSAE